MGKDNQEIEIEILEAGGCGMHSAGQSYQYPQDAGSLCPRLLESIYHMIRARQPGGELPRNDQSVQYETLEDNDQQRIELLRCPDLNVQGVVAKIKTRKLPGHKEALAQKKENPS